MAFCVFIDGTTKTLPPEKAIAIWQILNGEKEPENKAQADFCDKVRRLYLNRENAPQSYLHRFPQGFERDSQVKNGLLEWLDK